MLFKSGVILFIVEQLTFFKRGHTWINNDKAFEIQHAFDITQRHIKQQADTRWQ